MPRIIEEQTVDGLNLRKLTVSLQNWGKRQCQCTNTSRVGEAPWLLWHASVSDGVALVRCGVAVINARKKQARGGNVGLGCLALRFVSSALNLWWHRTPWQPPGQSGAAPPLYGVQGAETKEERERTTPVQSGMYPSPFCSFVGSNQGTFLLRTSSLENTLTGTPKSML